MRISDWSSDVCSADLPLPAHEIQIMSKLVDSHVHLDDDAFTQDREAVIERARQAGVETMVIPAVDTSSWSRIKALCASHTGLHPAYGLHPVFLPQHAPTDVDALSSWQIGRAHV